MTTLETPAPFDVTPIGASSSCPLTVTDPLGIDPTVAAGFLSTARLNPSLPVLGTTQFRQRCCEHEPVKGWPDPCSPAYDPDNPQHLIKCSSGCMDLSPEFGSFTFYSLGEVNCPDPGYDIDVEAARLVDQFTGWVLSRELDYAPISGCPSLRTLAWDLTPASGPVSPRQALMILTRAYRGFGSPPLTIHVPPELLFLLDGVTVNRGGIIRTIAGDMTILPGAGYTGEGALHDATGAPQAPPPGPGDGVYTMYATRGHVEYNVGAIDFYGDGVVQHELTNTWMVEAKRRAITRFNTECVFAIQINAADAGCCCA